MKTDRFSRRQALTRTAMIMAGAAAGTTVATANAPAGNPPPQNPFVFSLNTGTLRGHKLGLVRELEITAEAGYRTIEPWVEAIDRYAQEGGSLPELKRRIADMGLTVACAIGFPEWIVDDDAQRARGFERAKREMDLVAQIGGLRLAAPPAGATNQPGLDLRKAAERYRALLELGDEMGVVPHVELWGFSQNLNRLGDCAYIAIESGHPKAAVLADVFHLYKGGTDFHGLKLLSAQALQVFHLNDYPADPPRAEANDSNRIMPGDGVAPMTQILRDLASTGGQTVLSLELFNRSYWEQDPLHVARLGLAKMQSAVKTALG
jgi:sugar phosphate isomerase/epimerase